MLGKQMGLDPLWTLLALYAGYRFFGILGMILFPVGPFWPSSSGAIWTPGPKMADAGRFPPGPLVV